MLCLTRREIKQKSQNQAEFIIMLNIPDTDECASNPCMNRAICVEAFNMFECDCRPGYSGYQCEIGTINCGLEKTYGITN